MTTNAQTKLKNNAPSSVPEDTCKTSPGDVLHELAEHRHDLDYIARSCRSGEYPYKTKISKSAYESRKKELQVELLKVQKWVKETGQRIVNPNSG